MLADLDYARLRKSFELLVQRLTPPELLTSWTDPVAALERNETRSLTMARRGLYAAIGDFVEATRDLSAAQTRDIDSELESRGAYTLSFLRPHFSRRRNKT